MEKKKWILRFFPPFLFIFLLIASPALSFWLFIYKHGTDPLKYHFLPLFIISSVGTVVIIFFFLRAKYDFISSKKVATLMAVGFLFISFISSMIYLYLFWTFHNLSWIFKIPYFYLHLCCLIQFISLSFCAMRPRLYLYLISYPCSIFFSSNIYSLPFLSLMALWNSPVPQIIFSVILFLCFIGLYQTLLTRAAPSYIIEDVCLRSETSTHDSNKVKKVEATGPQEEEGADFKTPLRIIQITDPHLGPMMSIDRLKYICENAVKLNPDLILLTGDFFTAEVYGTENALQQALSPLQSHAGKTFACLGNHDKEGIATMLVSQGLQSVGVRLLVDEVELVDTPMGKVQVLGLDYRFGGGVAEHVPQVCKQFPPVQDAVRLILLHDPSAFQYVPETDGALVLSGHTHGGTVGLVSFGVRASVVGMMGIPDSGLWKKASNYLYVHRGQGCRTLLGSMLLRLGIPTEDSLLRVYYEA